jgi:hypothetical protein
MALSLINQEEKNSSKIELGTDSQFYRAAGDLFKIAKTPMDVLTVGGEIIYVITDEIGALRLYYEYRRKPDLRNLSQEWAKVSPEEKPRLTGRMIFALALKGFNFGQVDISLPAITEEITN